MADAPLLSSGWLDRVVILQRRVNPPERNELGEPIETWVDLGTVWAQVVETGGSENVRADEEAAVLRATFTIRFTYFTPSLNPRDRILYNSNPLAPAAEGYAYNITRVRMMGRYVGHIIDAATRGDQQ